MHTPTEPLFPVEWLHQPEMHTDTLPGMEFLP